MLKRDITYEDLDGNEVTDTFYFNFTKLDLLEIELEAGGLDKTLKELTRTQDGKKAYYLFKDIVLKAYGRKSANGRGFEKVDENDRPLSREFEASPACSELIISFLNNPDEANKFVQECLPSTLVEEVKAEAAEIRKKEGQNAKDQNQPELPVSPPELEPEKMMRENESKYSDDISDEDLLKMDPQKMTQPQLVRAMRLKSQQ